MSLSLETLLPQVRPQAPACPDTLALGALRDAAAEFCERTLAWRQTLGAMDVLAGQAFYTVAPPPGAELVMVLNVFVAGQRLAPTTEEWLNDDCPGWTTLAPATPSRYLLASPGQIRLLPPPAKYIPAGLVVAVALRPAGNATLAEDFLVSTWGRALAHGALAILLAMPGQRWSQAALAEHHARQFRAALVDARGQVLKGGQPASLGARPREFV